MVLFDLMINFLEANPHLAYLVLFLGSYFEILIGPNFFIFGEIFFYPGAILAGIGVLNIWLVALACISGGILGDSSSYFIGRKYGHFIVKRFFKAENKYLTLEKYRTAMRFIHRKGLKGIFFARLMGPISWIVPFLAGTIKVKYKTFLKYNVPSVIVGIGQALVIGYFFGFSYSLFLSKLQKDVFYAVLILLAIFLMLVLNKLDVFKKVSLRLFKRYGK